MKKYSIWESTLEVRVNRHSDLYKIDEGCTGLTCDRQLEAFDNLQECEKFFDNNYGIADVEAFTNAGMCFAHISEYSIQEEIFNDDDEEELNVLKMSEFPEVEDCFDC